MAIIECIDGSGTRCRGSCSKFPLGAIIWEKKARLGDLTYRLSRPETLDIERSGLQSGQSVLLREIRADENRRETEGDCKKVIDKDS